MATPLDIELGFLGLIAELDDMYAEGRFSAVDFKYYLDCVAAMRTDRDNMLRSMSDFKHHYALLPDEVTTRHEIPALTVNNHAST